ncbi:MAG: hypothetical protein PUB74_05010, partial [Bifidobacterium boum]|nr:hypothetical protein [Bifidobacterium boum]
MSNAVGMSISTSWRSADERCMYRIRKWLAVPKNLLHLGVLVAYLAVVITVMCFHEPWFDEAQSWLIARDCSWHDLLFSRTHYEGHPPLWWTLLAIPAKTGVPYEIGLKGVQLLTATLMIWLLVFRTALPEILKVVLPFTYFLCYQYGVTSRPYALLIASMLLVGVTWERKNEHPWRLVSSMMLMCATSSYGLVVCAGLAVLWVFSVLFSVRSGGIRTMAKSLVSSPMRFVAWLTLLAVAVALLLDVWPADDAYRGTLDILKPMVPWGQRWAYVWLFFPSETLFTSFSDDTLFLFMHIPVADLVYAAVVSLLMWMVLGWIAYRRGLLSMLLLPYFMLSMVFCSYVTGHHLGVVLGYLLMVLTMCCARRPLSRDDIPQWLGSRWDAGMKAVAERRGERYARRCARACSVLVVLPLLIGVYWTAYSSICDIRYNYSGSRAMASFIERYHLEHYRWMTGWSRMSSKIPNSSFSQWYKSQNGNVYCASKTEKCVDFTSWSGGSLIVANPYFDVNLIDNAYQGRTYLSWEWLVNQKQRAAQDIADWRSKPEPEFYDTVYQ